MKTIKFRGKSEKTGEWLYGSLINNTFFNAESKAPVLYVIDTDKMDYDCFEDFAEQMDDYKVNTVDQYTGLKDKNEVDIYEGDIVNFSLLFGLYFGSVEFINGAFKVKSSDYFEGDTVRGPGHDYYDMVPSGEVEVIGNIHENPELLEVEA